MIKVKTAALAAAGFVGAVLVASGAMAADAVQAIPVTAAIAPAAAPSDVAALVELFGGFDSHKMWDDENLEDADDCQGCHSTGLGFGGEGRAAWMVTPTLSMQLNVWAEHWSGRTEFPGAECEDCNFGWDSSRQGIGTHLTYNAGDFQVGGFASLGTRNLRLQSLGFDEATYANAGIEAAFNASQFRLYGQAGHTMAIGPAWLRDFWADEDIGRSYGRLVGTFYPQPNVALSANVGMEVMRAFGDLWGRLLTWGARADFQPDGKPMYFFASYQGGHNAYVPFADLVNFQVVDHVVRLGIGLNVGSPDIQTRDKAVGLADYNCTFGVQSTPSCLAWLVQPPRR